MNKTLESIAIGFGHKLTFHTETLGLSCQQCGALFVHGCELRRIDLENPYDRPNLVRMLMGLPDRQFEQAFRKRQAEQRKLFEQRILMIGECPAVADRAETAKIAL